MNDSDYKKAIGGINIDTDKLKNEIITLNEELEKLLERQKELTDSGQKNSKAYQDVAVQVRLAKAAIKETTAQIDSNVKALNLSKGSLEQNKGLLKSLQDQYTALSAKQGDNSKQLKELNTLIQTVSTSVDEQEKKLKESREAIDFHGKSVEALGDFLDEIKDSTEDLDKALGTDFSDTLESVSSGFDSMKEGISQIKTGFQSIGGAIKTTGFGLLLLILQSVTEYFTNTKEGAEKLRMWLARIGVIVDNVSSAFSKLKLFIGNAVMHPIDSIKNLGNIIEENIINRFKAFSVILDGIIHLNFKKVGDGIIQAFTGVTNATDKAVTAYKIIKKGVTDTYNEAEVAAAAMTNEALAEKKAKDEAIAKEKAKQEAEAKRRKNEAEKAKQRREAMHQESLKKAKERKEQEATLRKEAEVERLASIARMSQKVLEGYAKEITDTESHFNELKQKYKNNKATVEQLQLEQNAAIAAINKKFHDEDAAKLDGFYKDLNKISINARKQAQIELDKEYDEKRKQIQQIKDKNDAIMFDASQKLDELKALPQTAESKTQIDLLLKQQTDARKIFDNTVNLLDQLENKYNKDTKNLNKHFDRKDAQEKEDDKEKDIKKGTG